MAYKINKWREKSDPQLSFGKVNAAKISASAVHILSLFPVSFQRFPLKFGENVARKSGTIKGAGEILFFASFKSYDRAAPKNDGHLGHTDKVTT